jgi:hypothetical protein
VSEAGNLNKQFQILIHLICESISSFRHYDPKKIALSISRSRNRYNTGVLAYIVPLRYVGGKELRKSIRGNYRGFYRYESEDINSLQPEALYLMTFLVPKFFRLSLRQRAETIVHELYHIHPEFRGDLRRFSGAHRHHGPTPKQYDAQVKRFTDELFNNAPELLQHPLFLMNPEESSSWSFNKFRIPKRKFIFWTPDLFKGLLTMILIWIFFLCIGRRAQAAMDVYVSQNATLFNSSSDQSKTISTVEKNTPFRAVKQSKDKKWVYVMGGDKKGWIRKEFLNTTLPTEKDEPKDEDFSIDNDGVKTSKEEKLFFEESPAFSRKGGELFETPSREAERFGLIEKGDELQVIKRNAASTWFYVRIKMTGEEGWVPEEFVKFEGYEGVSVSRRNSVELLGAFGSKRISWGGGLGYTINLWPQGMAGRVRDRFELGLFWNYHKSSYQTPTSRYDVTRTSHVVPIEFRYVPATVYGRFFGIMGLGFVVIKNFFSSMASDAILNSEGARTDTWIYAPSVNIGAGFNMQERFYFYWQSRMLMKSSIIMHHSVGLGWRF